jgi:predicted component of type VI protein secretion system
MKSLSPVVRILNSPRAGEAIPVAGRTLIVGREYDCHLRLESAFVSRHHCALLRDDYTLRIRDLGSRNGTMVNNVSIGLHGVVLLHGDTVTVGEFKFQIEMNAARKTMNDGGAQVSPNASAMPTVNVVDGDTAIADSPQHVKSAHPESIRRFYEIAAKFTSRITENDAEDAASAPSR